MQAFTKSGCSWSGGKDSCYALMQAVHAGSTPCVLLNMLNEQGRISRSHGLPISILQRQAAAASLPLITGAASWNDYEARFKQLLSRAKEEFGVNEMVFGDIDLQAHRDWEERVCGETGLGANLPLWNQDRKTLVLEMLDAGMVARIISCNRQLGPAFIGRLLNRELLPELEAAGVDVCGENGEFHTVVTDCPMFKEPVVLPSYEVVEHQDYWFAVFDA